jgi:hypothetical protein
MTRIQIRRDTAANWTSANPILLQGEYGRETDTGNVKVGDGTHTWTELTYDNQLEKLDDVTISTPTNGQVLTYSNGDWINSTPSSGVTDHTLLSNIGTNTHSAIDTFIGTKGAASGLAPLNASSKIDPAYLPDSVVGALEYKGTFDASGGSFPTATPETGWYYVCATGGTISTVVYTVGDWIVYNGSTWDKIDNTDSVTSVDGATGAVSLTSSYIAIPGSSVQGDVIYHNGTGYVRLGPGTSGQVFKTGGSGANPSWSNIDGGSSSG